MSITRPVIQRDAAVPLAQPIGSRRIWMWVAVAGIAGAALALRLWAIRQSLPYVDHPDEPNPVDYVLRMLRTGDPNQHFFQKPSLLVYLLFAVLSLHYQLGLAAGLYPPIDQLAVVTHTVTSVPEFFFWGRVLVATLGGLTVATAFGVGRRAWGAGAGVVGALFVAVAPFHVRFSRVITTDVLSAWLVLLAFGASLTIVRGGRWRAYVVAGAFAGLAASAKYNAGLAACMVVAAHCVCWRRDALRQSPRLVLGGLAALAAFFAGSPYLLLSWREALAGIVGQYQAYQMADHGYYGGAWNVRGYLEFLWGDGLRPAATLAALLGVALLLRRRPGVGLVWLSFALPTLAVHMSMRTHFMQNMLPLVVLCSVPIGVAVAACVEWVKERWPARSFAAPLAAVALTALLLAPGAAETARATAQQVRGDTRVQFLQWLETHVPPGVRVAAELKPLPGGTESRWTDIPALPMHDMAWYRQQGYSYIVTSSKRWEQPAMPPSYAALLTMPPVAEFGVYEAGVTLGPHLLVYATGLGPADVPAPQPDAIEIGGARFLGVLMGQNVSDGTQPVPGVDPTRRFHPGDVLALRTFWQVRSAYDADYFIFVHVLNAQGATVAQRDAPPWQGRFPTTTWRSGSLVVDVNDVFLPAGLPPGEYRVVVGMFHPQTFAHPPMTLGGQPAQVDAAQIGIITIVK